MLRDEWGIHILEKTGIRIQDIQFPKEYQAALALEKKTTLEAKAEQKRKEIEAKARASELVGTMIHMIHENTGKAVRTIRKEIRDDPAKFFETHKLILEKNYDLLNRKLAIDGSSFVDIRVEGAQGIERALLNILTAWQRMPQGKKGKKEEKDEKTPARKKNIRPTKEGVEKMKEKILQGEM
jgi:hypothetical protein